MKRLFKCCSLLCLSSMIFTLGCNEPLSRQEDKPALTTNKLGVEIYPHSELFKKKDHGSLYVQDSETCLKCHSSEKQKANKELSCARCHSNFPHPGNWAVPANHGVAALENGEDSKKQCMTCHNGESGKRAMSCQTCHKAYPHSEDFKSGGDNHGALAKTYEGKCSACHVDMKKHMPNLGDAGCTTCHSGAIEIHWKDTVASKTDSTQRSVAGKKKQKPTKK